MPRLSQPALLRRLGEKPASAAIFLHGPEEYLRERTVQAIIERMLDPATRDFNLDQLRGGDVTPEGLASLLATPPMMATHRIVVLREVQGLGAKAREVVEAVVGRPYGGLVLVLTGTIPSGTKAKFYDVLKSEALSVEFGAVDPMDLPGWLIDHAESEHGVDIDVDAARALAAAIGSDLGVLAAEIEKAVAYIGARKRITLEDVRAVAGYIPRVDRWRWVEMVGERRFQEALEQVPDLLDTGETAVGLVLALGGQFLKLGLLLDGGREAFLAHVRGQKWLADKLLPHARRWTREGIDRALAELLRADRLLKSAPLDDRHALEELLLRLANDTQAGADRRGALAAGGIAARR